MQWLNRLLGRLPARITPAITASSREGISTPENRSVRVFISSTFADMQRERDVLVRQTFPSLRERFRARGVELREVDLRWGITREQAESGEILPVCLAEIDRCRPYFIGLLGERYGWIPSGAALTDRLRESFPAIAGASGRSVTELEIIHGVLASPENGQAFFFERDPAWIRSLEDEEAPEEPKELSRKQSDLKRRIRASGARVIPYTAPGEIGAVVEAALGQALEARFPDPQEADPFAQDLRLHEAYARERIGIHVGAEPYLDALDRWLAEEDTPSMLVTGAPGSGKSTLIANWLHRQRSRGTALIFEHYLGSSPDSANPLLLMRRLWEYLNRATGEIALPTGQPDLMELSDGLARRLSEASAYAKRHGTQIIIALDGLDKLAVEQNLRWLPVTTQPRLKMLASSLEGAASSAIRARGWATLTIQPLTQLERRTFVSRMLEAWGKRLSPSRTARILAHHLSGTPLFLRTVLDELRYSATEARLDSHLSLFLEARDMDDLFVRVLERVEDDCGRSFALKALSLIWASRAGLEETELLAITGALPLSWSVLRNGLTGALRNHGGRITFSHDFLRLAVGKRYLPDATARRAAHLALADHFEGRPIDPRQIEELPFQLRAAGAWDRLEALLLDLNRFGRQLSRGEAEYLSHWLPLKERGRDLETLLVAAFEARIGGVGTWPREALLYANHIYGFLEFAGMRGAAWQRLAESRAVVARGILGRVHLDTIVAKGQLAETYHLRGDFGTAKAIYEEVLETCRATLGDAHVETLTTMNNLAAVLFDLDDHAGAQAYFEHVLEARTFLLGVDDPETIATRNNLAQTFLTRGDLDGAIGMQQQVLESSRRVLGPDDSRTLTYLVNLGMLHRRRGDLDIARQLLDGALATVDRVLGPEHPLAFTACSALGLTVAAMGDHIAGKACAERAFEGSNRVLGPERVETLSSMSDLATALFDTGDFAGARELYEKAYEARTRVLGAEHPDTLLDMANLAVSLYQLGDLLAAERLLVQLVEATTRRVGPDHPDTQSAIADLAATRAAMNKAS